MSITESVQHAAHWLSYVTGYSAHCTRVKAYPRIIMLHEVGTSTYPVSEFERQIIFLKKNFTILPLGQVVDRLMAKETMSGLELALTFDDGLKNNFTHAYPILKKHEVPATFFICPELMDKGEWLWNHEVRARMKFLSLVAYRRFLTTCSELGFKPIDPTVIEMERIVAWMKSAPIIKRLTAETALRHATPEFKPTAEQSAQYDLLTWEEVRQMDRNLITIGSHSMSHPILSTLDELDVKYEVITSREKIEEKLGRPIDLFCYPDGAYNQTVRDVVSQVYTAAVGTHPAMIKGQEDIFTLPRIGGQYSLPTLAWRLHRP